MALGRVGKNKLENDMLSDAIGTTSAPSKQGISKKLKQIIRENFLVEAVNRSFFR